MKLPHGLLFLNDVTLLSEREIVTFIRWRSCCSTVLATGYLCALHWCLLHTTFNLPAIEAIIELPLPLVAVDVEMNSNLLVELYGGTFYPFFSNDVKGDATWVLPFFHKQYIRLFFPLFTAAFRHSAL